MGRFWLLYYLIFGPKYMRWALLRFALAMGFFFFCFVHEAFDVPRPEHPVTVAHHTRAIKARTQAIQPEPTRR
jgi:hypothetical protein